MAAYLDQISSTDIRIYSTWVSWQLPRPIGVTHGAIHTCTVRAKSNLHLTDFSYTTRGVVLVVTVHSVLLSIRPIMERWQNTLELRPQPSRTKRFQQSPPPGRTSTCQPQRCADYKISRCRFTDHLHKDPPSSCKPHLKTETWL